jgi:hypothetical protein
MQWLRGLGNWLLRLIELSRPSVDDRPAAGNVETRTRSANWADVFFLLGKLEKHSAEYVLVGGYALAFNGLVRQTGDIDIVVKNTPGNNRRWIAALCELPDGAARELVPDSDHPFPIEIDETTGKPEPGVIRIADEFLVDVMPKACGLTFDDLAPFIQRVSHAGLQVNVLDLEGLRRTKQTMRARDAEDLRHIEAALSALRGQISEHVRSMARRPILRETQPLPGRIEFRTTAGSAADPSYGERRRMAHELIGRAKAEGSSVATDEDTLAAYADREQLSEMLRSAEPISDLESLMRKYGIELPRFT